MNGNIDLRQILKDYPKGTKLYSPLFGEVELDTVWVDTDYFPISVKWKGNTKSFMVDGRYFDNEDGECMLFPTKGIRDWEFWVKMTT